MKIFLIMLTCIGLFGCTDANLNVPTPALDFDHIKPANVPVKRGIVSGTINVRWQGVMTDPNDISYSFIPDFPGSTGFLTRVAEGTYALHVEVPLDNNYTLTISANYRKFETNRYGTVQQNDNVSGSLRMAIPYGRDHDVGVQFLDLH